MYVFILAHGLNKENLNLNLNLLLRYSLCQYFVIVVFICCFIILCFYLFYHLELNGAVRTINMYNIILYSCVFECMCLSVCVVNTH